MQENGVSVSELQTQLLQKIEELTLYILQQEETIQELRQEVEKLKKNNPTALRMPPMIVTVRNMANAIARYLITFCNVVI